MASPKQRRLFPEASASEPRAPKLVTDCYHETNCQIAELFLADPERYAGIQLEWAQLWKGNH